MLEGAYLVFSDESGCSTYPPVRRTWGRRGRTPLIATTQCHRRQVNNWWLCMDLRTGMVWLVYVAQRAPIIQEHLPALIDRVQAPVVLVRDNYSSQTTVWVHRELVKRPWLSIVRLPTYAPELNPVETLWSGLKTFLANRAFQGVGELERTLWSHLWLVQKCPAWHYYEDPSVPLAWPCPIPSPA